jgi:HD-GYP domain-containing protein (c-di-GMP phosphodiesterase class II)
MFKGEFKIKTPEDIKSKYNEFRYNFLPIKNDEYNLNWVIMFEIPTDAFKDKMISVSIVIGLGGLLTVLILIVFSRLIINGALKPIDQIVIAMNKAADGDLSVRTDVKSSNEIEVISVRLNEMLDHMETDRDDLVNQKNEILVLLDEVEELVQENNRVYYETIKTLAKTIDAKDTYTGGHCDRVTEVSTKIGIRLGLSSDDIRVLSYSGMLHDIGKIGISEAIITKEGKLTEEEFDEIKKHPEIGFGILKNINFLKRSSEVVYRHHEKLDGSGYPNNLKGDEIDILSRIIAVADSFDAMSSDRSYRKALSREICISELKRCSGSQFDGKIVSVLIDLLDDDEIIAFKD